MMSRFVAVFERWAEHVEEEMEMKQKLKRAAMKMFQGALTRSFDRWEHHTCTQKKTCIAWMHKCAW